MHHIPDGNFDLQIDWLMKPALLFSTIFTLACCTVNSAEVTMLTHQARRAKYEWRIEESRLSKLPKWEVREGPCPLSMDSAVRKALDWFSKRGHEGADIYSIGLTRLARLGDPPELWGLSFYTIYAQTGFFDTMACMVMLNGEVLEPVEVKRTKTIEPKTKGVKENK